MNRILVAAGIVTLVLGAAIALSAARGAESAGELPVAPNVGVYKKYCLSCHRAGGPQTPTLSKIDQTRANHDAIDRSAAAGPKAVNTYMPQDGSVPESERRQLGEWLACGAPE